MQKFDTFTPDKLLQYSNISSLYRPLAEHENLRIWLEKTCPGRWMGLVRISVSDPYTGYDCKAYPPKYYEEVGDKAIFTGFMVFFQSAADQKKFEKEYMNT